MLLPLLLNNGIGLPALSGSSTATLDAATCSATGALAVSGSLSATLGTLTATESGAVAIAGSGSTTLANATLAASGAVAIAGSLTATLGGATGSASGTLGGGTTPPEPEPTPTKKRGIPPIHHARRRGILVEVDGELFVVDTIVQAEALLRQARELAEEIAPEAAAEEREPPRVTVSADADPALARLAAQAQADIEAAYQRAAEARAKRLRDEALQLAVMSAQAQLSAARIAQAAEEDDEDALLAMLM